MMGRCGRGVPPPPRRPPPHALLTLFLALLHPRRRTRSSCSPCSSCGVARCARCSSTPPAASSCAGAHGAPHERRGAAARVPGWACLLPLPPPQPGPSMRLTARCSAAPRPEPPHCCRLLQGPPGGAGRCGGAGVPARLAVHHAQRPQVKVRPGLRLLCTPHCAGLRCAASCLGASRPSLLCRPRPSPLPAHLPAHLPPATCSWTRAGAPAWPTWAWRKCWPAAPAPPAASACSTQVGGAARGCPPGA